MKLKNDMIASFVSMLKQTCLHDVS